MADYIRKYPEAPTPEEIETGYAPSTVQATPFIKFAIWTFVGLGISYAIAYGSFLALDKVQEIENDQAMRLATRRNPEMNGPRLQPSPGHDTLDFEDKQIMLDKYKVQLSSRGLWKEDPQKRSYGEAGVSDAVANKARAALQGWGASAGNQPKQ